MFKGHLFIFLVIYVRKKVWELYSMLDESNAQLFGHDSEENKKIRHQMYEIGVELREIEDSINPQIIHDSMEILKPNVLLVRCLDVMGIFLTDIDNNYRKFDELISQKNSIFDRPLAYLTRSAFLDIKSNIQMIRKIMTGPGELLPHEQNLITAISGYSMNHHQELCDSSQPISEILVDLFKKIIIAEIKTSLMLTFANLHGYWENQGWMLMNISAKLQFQRYFKEYLTNMQQNFNITTSLYIRACDPENSAWILDENYYELDGIIQATIFQYKKMVCPFQSCQSMWQKRTSECDASYYDERSSCPNTATECENLGAVQACVLKSGPHKFQYVNSTVLGPLGRNFKCPEDDGYIIDNGKRSESQNATCACDCNRNHNKISLFLMNSRVELNMVITGLRFIRRNNILYIQPREGKLQANGYIHQYSQKWLPVPTNIGTFQTSYINKENSIFFLDDLLLPPKFVLTGVRFNKATRGTVTGFIIEIFGVPFNYRRGTLDTPRRIRLFSSNENLWQPLTFGQMSPLRAESHNRPSTTNLKYIELKRSLLEDDFGQSTLPLFDAVPLTTDPPSVLGGIGIFHKGVDAYGGFISLRAYGIRYEQYFENFTSAHTIDGQLQLFT